MGRAPPPIRVTEACERWGAPDGRRFSPRARVSAEGCDAFQEMLQHTKIGPWFSRMKEAVTNHEGGGAVV